jgi:small subunit ribosomal protein S4
MGTYHGPKVRLTRRFGVPMAETPKHVNLRRPRPPGVHGRRRERRSLYGEQLVEKQRLCSYYNIRERQFTRYAEQAQSMPGSTTDALQRTLETRFDNVIRRLRWASTIWQARQMVSHGHFLVNGCKVDVPEYHVKAGDEITVKPRSGAFVRQSIQEAEKVEIHTPDWLSVDAEHLKAKVLRLPDAEEIRLPFEINLAKIIEFYTR